MYFNDWYIEHLQWNSPFRWMLQEPSEDKSTLVQVMAWCHQAPSHYLTQCWTSSMTSYAITRGQWVKILRFYFWNQLCLDKIGHRHGSWCQPNMSTVIMNTFFCFLTSRHSYMKLNTLNNRLRLWARMYAKEVYGYVITYHTILYGMQLLIHVIDVAERR